MANDPHADDVTVERGKALLFDLLLHMNATQDVLDDTYVADSGAPGTLSLQLTNGRVLRLRMGAGWLRRVPRPRRRACSFCSSTTKCNGRSRS